MDTKIFPVSQLKIGVLALQGAYAEHLQFIRSLGAKAFEVRLPEDLNQLDGLIIPGGESPAIGKLAAKYNLISSIKEFAKSHCIWGTCAGAILMAKEIEEETAWLELMDIKVQRNAFGRQVDSFIQEIKIAGITENTVPFPAIFIRAPAITAADPIATVIATTQDGQIAAVQQERFLATIFHPELGTDMRMHNLFLEMVADQTKSGDPPTTYA